MRSHPQETEYELAIDSEVVCLWFTESCVFAEELNLKLKPQENDSQLTLNLIYMWSHPLYTEYKVLIDSEVVCFWFLKSCVSTA